MAANPDTEDETPEPRMKSRHSEVSGSSTATPASSGGVQAGGVQAGGVQAAGVQAAGAGNAAAQEAMQKKMGGGTWQVQSGDTLSRIASRRYGNAALWEAIRDSNPDRVKDGGRLIYVGTILDIPELDAPEPTPEQKVDATGDVPAKEPVSRVTEFGTFEIYPDDYEGPLPESADGVQRVRQWRFAEIEAEAASETVNADIEALDGEVSFAEPVVISIGQEQVRVSSKAEAQHAAQMFKEIQEVYGIQVNSQVGVDAIKARYTKVPPTELEKLRTKEWEYKEVLGLHRALEHFAPILGANREGSSEAGTRSGVSTVSKLDQAIDADAPEGKLDSQTLGEYLVAGENLSLFTKGTDSTFDFDDNMTQLEATAVHELAHGLMRRELIGYAAATGYWADLNQPFEDAGQAEQPMTKYAYTSAAEDLSEATMYYFTEPESLSTKCPLRYAYIDRVVSSWSSSPA